MEGCKSDLHKHNSLCLNQLISTQFASANTCQAVLWFREFSISRNKVLFLCYRCFWRVFSKQTELRHSTNYFLVVAASIILSTSPRYSEVLFSRGRHSKWPICILIFWDIGFFFVSEKSQTAVHCAPQLNFHCSECLCSNYLSTVAAQLSTIPRHWASS